MFFSPSTVVAILGLVSAAPALAAPTGESSLPSVRRSLASKLQRRAEKVQRQADAQKSLTLDPSQIAAGLANNGQAGGGDPGQVASLTSTNNFINFCLTQNGVPLTNGQQVKGGSCNGVPMGRIVGQNKMPSCKFTNPKNGDTIPANQAFTITMAIQNLVTGNFVNPNTNYYSAPQQVDGSGTAIGHSHVTVELLSSLAQTTPTDATKFAFFKGLNEKAQGGVLSAAVTAGLAPGAYRMCSINSAANHQPVLVAVAQRGSVDDCVYFTTSANGAGAGNGGNNGGNAGNNGGNAGNNGGNAGNNGGNAATTSAAAAATSAAAGNNGGNGRGGNGGGRGGNNGGRGGNNAAAAASTALPTAAASSAAPAVTTPAAAGAGAGAAAGNFQKFTGTLGGAAPPVTAGGKGFLINGDSFINKAGALQRSCDVQKNACANAANSSGNKAPLTVAACETQATACAATVSA